MDETLRKAIKTGFGLGLLTMDEAKKVAEKVKKDLGLNEKESRLLAKELVSRSDAASKDMMKAAEKHMDKALLASGLVKKSELAGLKKTVRSRVRAKMKAVGKAADRKRASRAKTTKSKAPAKKKSVRSKTLGSVRRGLRSVLGSRKKRK